MSTGFTTITWEVDNGIGTLWLDRPDHLNGIVHTMMRELHECLHTAAADTSLAVVILTGRGRAFCPGADLKADRAADEPLKEAWFDVPLLLHEMPQVTIAAVNGACAGAGLGFALACDLRYASSDAKLNTAFLDVAVAGDMGVPWTLPRIVGAGRARELSLLPRKLTANEAQAIGMVNEVFDGDQLLDEVGSRARRIAAASPRARAAMKEHYVAAERQGFADFLALESSRHMSIASSADTREAFRAFVEKRQPIFGGS